MDQIESVRKMFVLLFSASMLVAILLIGIIGLRDRQEEGSARDWLEVLLSPSPIRHDGGHRLLGRPPGRPTSRWNCGGPPGSRLPWSRVWLNHRTI